jgi:hypothetical protein
VCFLLIVILEAYYVFVKCKFSIVFDRLVAFLVNKPKKNPPKLEDF